MDTARLVALIAAATFITGLLFGTHHPGLVPWLFGRRKARTPAVTPPTQSTDPAVEVPATAIVIAPPAPPQPAPPAQPSEPDYLQISRVLYQQGQPRAGKWACYLPQILANIGVIFYVIAVFTGVASIYLGPGGFSLTHPSWLAVAAGYSLLVCLGFGGLAWATPTIILKCANIAWLIHRLRTE